MKKKLLAALAVLGVAAPALAEGGSTTTMDTAAAAGIIQSAASGLEQLISTVTPYLTTLILAGLAIWAAMVILRIVKRAFSRAG